jgi:hypothetical protein
MVARTQYGEGRFREEALLSSVSETGQCGDCECEESFAEQANICLPVLVFFECWAIDCPK